MAERQHVPTPIGRFISGDLLLKRTTDGRNQPIAPEKQRFEFGVAIRKDAPGINEFWANFINACKMAWQHNPQVHPLIDQWVQNGFQGFSGKISDGDKPSARTQQVNPNSAGCWVIWFSTQLDIVVHDHNNVQIDPQMLKRGYYCDVLLSIAANNQAIGDGVGVFVNPDFIRLQGEGDVISGGVDPVAAAAMMGAPTGAPPGMRAPGSAPAAAQPMPAHAGQPAPAPAAQPAYQPAPAPQPGQQPMAQPAPQAGQPLPGGLVAPPAQAQQPAGSYPTASTATPAAPAYPQIHQPGVPNQ